MSERRRHDLLFRTVLPLAVAVGLLPGATSMAAGDGLSGSRSSVRGTEEAPSRLLSVAQATEPPGGASPSPPHTPAPIVPRGNPLGRVGIAAMVVAAVAGLWIYRVIRKGL
jgi:hypothetical protein